MTNATWSKVSETLPPDDAAVEVITPGGDQRTLIYDRGLWWLPDKSMYCYFTPMFWRAA